MGQGGSPARAAILVRKKKRKREKKKRRKARKNLAKCPVNALVARWNDEKKKRRGRGGWKKRLVGRAVLLHAPIPSHEKEGRGGGSIVA